MEDRRAPGLYLELADAESEPYGRDRAPQVAGRTGVTRATWWSNQHPDRDDVPRRLAEFATLGVYELGAGFTPPTVPEGVSGLHFATTPRPGQGVLGGDVTNGLLLVLISPGPRTRARPCGTGGTSSTSVTSPKPPSPATG